MIQDCIAGGGVSGGDRSFYDITFTLEDGSFVLARLPVTSDAPSDRDGDGVQEHFQNDLDADHTNKKQKNSKEPKQFFRDRQDSAPMQVDSNSGSRENIDAVDRRLVLSPPSKKKGVSKAKLAYLEVDAPILPKPIGVTPTTANENRGKEQTVQVCSPISNTVFSSLSNSTDANLFDVAPQQINSPFASPVKEFGDAVVRNSAVRVPSGKHSEDRQPTDLPSAQQQSTKVMRNGGGSLVPTHQEIRPMVLRDSQQQVVPNGGQQRMETAQGGASSVAAP